MQVDKNVIITVNGAGNWQFHQVLGLSTTLYTCIGGMKAVVWTDSLQAVMMYGGVAALIYRGLNNEQIGGFSRVWRLAVDSGRIGELARFDPSPAQAISSYPLKHRVFSITAFGSTSTRPS